MMFLSLVFSTATAMKAAMKPAACRAWPQQFYFSYEGKIQSGEDPSDFDYKPVGGDERSACLTILKGSFVQKKGANLRGPYVQYTCDNPTEIAVDDHVKQEENTKWILRPVHKGQSKFKPDSDYDLLNIHWELILSNQENEAEVVGSWTIKPDMIHVMGAGDATIITYPYWRADVVKAVSVQSAVNWGNTLQSRQTQLDKMFEEINFPCDVNELHKKAEDRKASRDARNMTGFKNFCWVKGRVDYATKALEFNQATPKVSGPRYRIAALSYKGGWMPNKLYEEDKDLFKSIYDRAYVEGSTAIHIPAQEVRVEA